MGNEDTKEKGKDKDEDKESLSSVRIQRKEPSCSMTLCFVYAMF
jgi:hypothetical protein